MLNVPGIFIVILLVASFYAKRFRILFLISAILFYLSSIYAVGNFLVSKIEEPYNIPLENTKADGVIVLGGGHYKGSINLPLEPGAFKRLVYAIMIAKKRNLPLVFAGADYELIATQDCIKEFNKNLDLNLTNISNDKIYNKFSVTYTLNSKNTIQNAMRAYDLFAKNGIKKPKIYLVTSAFHMYRARRIFEDFNFTTIPAATDFRTRSDSCYCFYYPSTNGLELTNMAIHEGLGSLRDHIKRIFK